MLISFMWLGNAFCFALLPWLSACVHVGWAMPFHAYWNRRFYVKVMKPTVASKGLGVQIVGVLRVGRDSTWTTTYVTPSLLSLGMVTETRAGPSPDGFFSIWLWLPSQKGRFLESPHRHIETDEGLVCIVILSTIGWSLMRVFLMPLECCVTRCPFVVFAVKNARWYHYLAMVITR